MVAWIVKFVKANQVGLKALFFQAYSESVFLLRGIETGIRYLTAAIRGIEMIRFTVKFQRYFIFIILGGEGEIVGIGRVCCKTIFEIGIFILRSQVLIGEIVPISPVRNF